MVKMRFHHYKAIYWVLPNGLLSEAYVPVVVHDDCKGCVVCERTSEWFMEFACLARDLIGVNLRDCLHWGHLFDNPQPLIVPTSNLQQVNGEVIEKLREAYYAIPEKRRPHLKKIWPHDRNLSQTERFEDRLKIVEQMVDLWEDGQYIGWPS